MSFWKGPGWVKVMVVAALAAGPVARTASAQVLKGRFGVALRGPLGQGALAGR